MTALSASLDSLPTSPRTGPLRSGNPQGIFNLAPRCGAKTRAGGCCQAPALRGRARCRLHGGASTGQPTRDGPARLAAAHTTHGWLTAEARVQLRHNQVSIRRTRVLTDALGMKH